MKNLIVALGSVFIVAAGAYGYGDLTNVNSTNTLYSEQNQQQTMQGQGYAVAEGGDASAVSGDSSSGATANISTTTVSNYETRTQPLSTYPPYLPFWNHGGWGTLKAYFPNGPAPDDQVYERTFCPIDPDDMREIRRVLESLPPDGPLDILGGILNGVGAIFGGPDNFHHGRGFEIANALIRDRRPMGKPLFVFIDSNVDRNLLQQAGYAYVGRVGLEGKVERNWDQVYDAAVAEALPWDVDILLISGGMKGVTVGSTVAFPSGAGGYSQANYSISLLGGVSGGTTEGKGKAIVSAEGYRYWPRIIHKRRIPQFLYDKIHSIPQMPQKPQKLMNPRKPRPMQNNSKATQQAPSTIIEENASGITVSQELFNLAGFEAGRQVEYLTIN